MVPHKIKKTAIFCEACNVSSEVKYVHYHKDVKMTLCNKHYNQLINKGKILDTNSHALNDPNEIRIFDDYAEIDVYKCDGSLFKTFKFDKEYLDLIKECKWTAGTKCRIFCRKYGDYPTYIMQNENPNKDPIFIMDTSNNDLRKSNLCVKGSDKYNKWIESKRTIRELKEKKKKLLKKEKKEKQLKIIEPLSNVCATCGITKEYRQILKTILPDNEIQYLCSKHAAQVRKYGKVMDHNQRIVHDPNEIRVFESYCEIDTYDQFGNVTYTFKFSPCDIEIAKSRKWQLSMKDKGVKPYLNNKDTDYFHRVILKDKLKPGLEVDHINGDSADNRRENLRIIKKHENQQNLKIPRNNTTGFKGVYHRKDIDMWKSEFQYMTCLTVSPTYPYKEMAIYFRYMVDTHFQGDLRNTLNDEAIKDAISKLTPAQKNTVDKDIKFSINEINQQLKKKNTLDYSNELS